MKNAVRINKSIHPRYRAWFPSPEAKHKSPKSFTGSVTVTLESGFSKQIDVKLELRESRGQDYEAFNINEDQGILYLPDANYAELVAIAEAAEKASKLRKSITLPAITGVSEAQISYAEKVRKDVLPQITEAFYEDQAYFAEKGISEADYAAALRGVTSARTWLDILNKQDRFISMPDVIWTDRGRNALLLTSHLGREI